MTNREVQSRQLLVWKYIAIISSFVIRHSYRKVLTYSSVASCQGRIKGNPLLARRALLSTELAGRGAGRGNSAVVTGETSLSRFAHLIASLASSYQLHAPLLVKW